MGGLISSTVTNAEPTPGPSTELATNELIVISSTRLCIENTKEVAEYGQSCEECNDDESSWWRSLRWCQCSKNFHRELETSILASINTPYRFRFVNIGPVVGNEDCKIWTLSLNESANGIPLLLLHGFASGLALWSLNLDDLAIGRPVHCIDILGFGGSSRAKFSVTAEAVEDEFISSIEAWRQAMQMERVILIGHSFGGFLCTIYSMRFPDAVEHLILADPWGFKERPEDSTQILNLPRPILYLLKGFVQLNFTPLWCLRLMGRIAPMLIQFFRQDLIKNFIPDVNDASRVLSNYIFQCNAQSPTGEAAFNCLMESFGWAKQPLTYRIHKLDEEIPLTVIYGTKSWIDHASAEEIHENRRGAFVDTHVVEGCGHHVYTENRPVFNKIVIQACMNTKSRNLVHCLLSESSCYSNDDFTVISQRQ